MLLTPIDCLRLMSEKDAVIVVEKQSTKLTQDYIHICKRDGGTIETDWNGDIIVPDPISRTVFDDLKRSNFIFQINDTTKRSVYEITTTGRNQVAT